MVPTVGHFPFPFLNATSTFISLNTSGCASGRPMQYRIVLRFSKCQHGSKGGYLHPASQGGLSLLDQTSSPESAGRTCGRWWPAGCWVVQCHLHKEQWCDAEALWIALAESVCFVFGKPWNWSDAENNAVWCVRGVFPPLPSSKKLWTVVLSLLQGKLPPLDKSVSSLKSLAQPLSLSRADGTCFTLLKPAHGNTPPFIVASKVKA